MNHQSGFALTDMYDDKNICATSIIHKSTFRTLWHRIKSLSHELLDKPMENTLEVFEYPYCLSNQAYMVCVCLMIYETAIGSINGERKLEVFVYWIWVFVGPIVTMSFIVFRKVRFLFSDKQVKCNIYFRMEKKVKYLFSMIKIIFFI